MKNLIFDGSIINRSINIFYQDLKDPVLIRLDLIHSEFGLIKSNYVEYDYNKGSINLEDFKSGLLNDFNNYTKIYPMSELSTYIYPNAILVNRLTGELQSSLTDFNKRVLRNFKMDKNAISEFTKFINGQKVDSLVPECLNNKFKIYYIGLPDVNKYRSQYNKKLLEIFSVMLKGVNYFLTSIKTGYNLIIEKKTDFFRKVDNTIKEFCCKVISYWDESIINSDIIGNFIPHYLKINPESLTMTEVNSIQLPGCISGLWKVNFVN